MKALNLIPGSAEWHAHRDTVFNASEAAALFGQHKYLTRSSLVARLAGVRSDEPVSPAQQAIFDRGHRAEAAARPVIEADIGEELFPVVGCWDEDERFSASFDGLTMLGDQAFECKLWNEKLAAAVNAGDLEPHYYWQLEHQLLVSGAELVVFVCAREDASEIAQMIYRPVAGRREQLIAAWLQARADAQSHTPEAPAAIAVAEPVMGLPAVSVQIEGTLAVLSNLPAFGDQLRTFIDGLNPAPESDQDFANAENEIKVLKAAEDELQAAEDRALAQISVVDEMRRTKAMLHKLARDSRLAREKLVKERKEFVRAQIQTVAVQAVSAHIAAHGKRWNHQYLPPIQHDIAGAMKGKKTLSSLKDAAQTEVARAKVEIDRIAAIIDANMETLNARASGHRYLFNDTAQLVLKDPEAVTAIVAQRIAQHEADQKRQAEEAAEREREKIRAEEQAKAQAEAKAREAAERAEREKAEREALAKVEAEERRRSEREEKKATRTMTPATQELPPQAPPAGRAIPDSQPAMKVYAELRRPERPTDAEIINLIATTYQVSTAQALEWVSQINTTEAQEA